MKQQPQAPNPVQVANAQTQSNKETAIAQAGLNAQNQVTPYGNLSYTQNGTWPDGTPKFVATTTLSPAQQQLLNTNQGTSQQLAQTAQAQAGRLDQALAQPFSLDNEATEARLMELGRKRLDPLLAERGAALESDLINRGLRPGSDAYDRAIAQKYQGENDAYNQLLLSGRGQAVNEALMARNQPINESIALASGTQVQQPQFVGTPQTGVGGTDVAGITQNAYQNQLNAYNRQQSDLYGGLFGLGSAAIGALPWASILSDKRLKTNIRDTGMKMRGVPVKDFTWKGTGQRDRGVMAQDVEKKFPHLVEMDPSGYRRVKIGRLMTGGM